MSSTSPLSTSPTQRTPSSSRVAPSTPKSRGSIGAPSTCTTSGSSTARPSVSSGTCARLATVVLARRSAWSWVSSPPLPCSASSSTWPSWAIKTLTASSMSRCCTPCLFCTPSSRWHCLTLHSASACRRSRCCLCSAPTRPTPAGTRRALCGAASSITAAMSYARRTSSSLTLPRTRRSRTALLPTRLPSPRRSATFSAARRTTAFSAASSWSSCQWVT
mmetsp:Transcript_12797/g.35040  ORF Transcript_12797/g.35040 Transcript_12797/m.35040 type:complete len:219 (-) Transcript_12797:1579-2235(-)